MWYHLISFNACGRLSKLSKTGQNNRMATRGLNESHWATAEHNVAPCLWSVPVRAAAWHVTYQRPKMLKCVEDCFSMVLPCCSVPSLLKVRAPNEVYWTNADRLAKPLLTWFNGTTSPGQTPHWDSYPRMNSDGSHVSCRNGEPVGLPWDTLWDLKLGWSPEPFSNPACCRQVLESFQSVQQNVWDTGIPMTWCKVVLFVMQQVFANSLPAAKAAGHRSRWEKTEAIVQDEEKKEGLHSFEQGGCPCILPGQHRILDGRIHSLQRWCVIPT